MLPKQVQPRMTVKKSECVTPEVPQYIHPLLNDNEAAHCCFETQRRCQQESKTGVYKGNVSAKIFLCLS